MLRILCLFPALAGLLVLAATAVLAQSPAATFGGSRGDTARGIVPDGAGGFVVVGEFTGRADFDDDSADDVVSAQGGLDIDAFIARYNAAGALVSVRGIGNPAEASSEFLSAIVADDAGGFVVTGSGWGTLDLGGDASPEVESLGRRDAFVARYDAAGVLVASRQIGSVGGDESGRALALDDGGLLVAGGFGGAVDLDGDGTDDLELSGGLEDGFVARFTDAGALAFAARIGGFGQDTALGVASDGAGGAFVVGRTRGAADLDGDGVADLPNRGAFIARYDAAGAFVWVRGVADSEEDGATACAPDGAGGVFVTGRFEGEADFDGDGTTDLTSSSFADTFVARYTSGGDLVFARSVTGQFDNQGFGAASDGAGGVLVAGDYRIDPDFDGDGTGDLPSSANPDFYLARYDGAGTVLNVRGGAGGNRGGRNTAYAVAADGAGGALVAGAFERALDVEGDLLVSNGSFDGFAFRYADVVVAAEPALPEGLALSVAPNPSAGAATARLALGAPGEATVAVFDALGRRVARLHDGPLAVGDHAFRLPALAPGLYLVRVQTPEGVVARALSVVR